MSDGYKARVIEEGPLFALDAVRLLVKRGDGIGRTAFLGSDGQWLSIQDDTAIDPDRVGLVLPAEALEAIVQGIEEWQGHTSHAETEARVLREWLAIERSRVDAALKQVVP